MEVWLNWIIKINKIIYNWRKYSNNTTNIITLKITILQTIAGLVSVNTLQTSVLWLW